MPLENTIQEKLNQSVDYEYVNGIKSGDQKILEKIYNDYYPGIQKYVEANSGTPDDAKDLFHDVLIVIFKKITDGNLNLTSSFYTYLYAVSKNLWLKKLRDNRNSRVTTDSNMEYTMADDAEEIHDMVTQEILYREKFLELSESCQKVLKLGFEKVSMVDITSIMGFSSVGYTKKRKFKCKEQLIRLIKTDKRYQGLMLI